MISLAASRRLASRPQTTFSHSPSTHLPRMLKGGRRLGWGQGGGVGEGAGGGTAGVGAGEEVGGGKSDLVQDAVVQEVEEDGEVVSDALPGLVVEPGGKVPTFDMRDPIQVPPTSP